MVLINVQIKSPNLQFLIVQGTETIGEILELSSALANASAPASASANAGVFWQLTIWLTTAHQIWQGCGLAMTAAQVGIRRVLFAVAELYKNMTEHVLMSCEG